MAQYFDANREEIPASVIKFQLSQMENVINKHLTNSFPYTKARFII